MNENLGEPAGYAQLIERFALAVPRPRHRSYIRVDSGERRTKVEGFVGDESFPAAYRPKANDDFDQLVFALKYDGVDLCVLAGVFSQVDKTAFAARISAQPSSKYGRRLFFLFELLTGERLPIGDANGVAYCEALDRKEYFVSKGVRSPRHRVIDNLLGRRGFCPIVRRTAALEERRTRDLRDRALAIASAVDPLLLARAVNYLYTKETRSSFAIEREDPSDRMQRFADQLAIVADLDLSNEPGLVELQNDIVDPRYREQSFRGEGDLEVYISEPRRHRIHHVGARSSITPELMRAWAGMRTLDERGGPVIEAACRSFAFVFIHPFGDGNGRIHRLLLHHVLAKRSYFPKYMVVPVSAVLLRSPDHYDQVLEDFSRRVMPHVRQSLDEDQRMTIHSAPDDAYRYPDLTPQCEATFDWLERALEEDLVEELDYLQLYDEIRSRIREVVEMPDRHEQLFIKLCIDNGGRLAKGKRAKFQELDDAIIERLEAIVAEAIVTARRS